MSRRLGLAFTDGIGHRKGQTLKAQLCWAATLADMKPVPVFHLLRFQKSVAVLVAHVGDIDDGERVGGGDDQLFAGGKAQQTAASLEDRQGTFEPPEIVKRRHLITRTSRTAFSRHRSRRRWALRPGLRLRRSA